MTTRDGGERLHCAPGGNGVIFTGDLPVLPDLPRNLLKPSGALAVCPDSSSVAAWEGFERGTYDTDGPSGLLSQPTENKSTNMTTAWLTSRLGIPDVRRVMERRFSCRGRHECNNGYPFTSVAIRADDFTAGSTAQIPIDTVLDGSGILRAPHVDRVLEEVDRAIGEQEVGAPGMLASKAEVS